jgi:hypothetical protein
MANIIVENSAAQEVDHEGNQYELLDDTLYHNGMKQCCHTSQGWERQIQWKDHSTNWLRWHSIKNLYMHGGFHSLLKRNMFTSKVKSIYWHQSHKYGIEIPKSVKNAMEFEQQNGDT